MNKIDAIVVHCSATRAGQDIGKKEINQMHVARGFQCIGYNYVIRLDGTVEVGRSLTIDGAHCNSKGFSGISYNKHSIGICYVGGLDAHGKAADTRTPAQKKSLRELLPSWLRSMILKRCSAIVIPVPTWTVMVSWNLANGRKCVLVSMLKKNIQICLQRDSKIVKLESVL